MHVCVVGFIRIIVLLIIWAIVIFGWRDGMRKERRSEGWIGGVGGYLSAIFLM
jgi:hypothetical protein